MTDFHYPLSPGALRLGSLLNDVITPNEVLYNALYELVARNYRMLCMQDRMAHEVPLPEDAPSGARAVWFNSYRTFMLNVGKNQGTSLLTHMLMDEKTLVIAPADVVDFLKNPPANPPGMTLDLSALTSTAHLATVVSTIDAGEQQLLTGKFEQVIVYGSSMFQRFTNEYWDLLSFIDCCSTKGFLNTPLPRLFILN